MKQVYINHFTMSITASSWSRSCCGHSHTVVSYRYCLCCSSTAMARVWLSMLLIFFRILIRHIYIWKFWNLTDLVSGPVLFHAYISCQVLPWPPISFPSNLLNQLLIWDFIIERHLNVIDAISDQMGFNTFMSWNIHPCAEITYS